MSRRRVLVTGSTQGLGLAAAERLATMGHAVTLHARDDARAAVARTALPGAEGVVVGDLSTLEGMRAVADQANASGRFHAVIHNAGVYRTSRRLETADGLEQTFAVNVLAPYVLTVLVRRPDRLVYVSSGLHRSGRVDLGDLRRRWDGGQAYADSKLMLVMLAFAVARRWPGVLSSALEPGWVATRMGGPGAPDDLQLGSLTQAWLAVSDEPAATVTGGYFFHQRPAEVHPGARDPRQQQELLDVCASISGATMPSRELA